MMRPAARPQSLPPDTPSIASYVGKACPWCRTTMALRGRSQPTREHLRPRSHGGQLVGKNRAVVCWQCNNDKGSMTLDVFVAWLYERADPRLEHVRAFMADNGHRRDGPD